MSDVFHSAGVPGVTRCSELATGNEARIPAGDEQRVSLAHECVCEIDALVRLTLSVDRAFDNALARRGMLLRVLALTDVSVSMLGIGEMPADMMAELRTLVMGDKPSLQGVTR